MNKKYLFLIVGIFLLSLTFVSASFGYNNRDLVYIRTLNDTLDPKWTANYTNMLTTCPTGNYSYGIFNNGTWKCRDDVSGAGGEVDPKWSANYTAYNDSWNLDTNTWDTSWFDNWTAYNTTWSAGGEEVYWNANYSAYNDSWTNWDELTTYNTTHFSDEAGVLTLVQSWIESFFNTLFSAKDTDDLTQGSSNLYDDTDWNKTYADELYSTIDEPYWTANFTAYNESWSAGGSETDPYWLANYSDFLTISAWNDSGLIQDWNASGLIINWSSDSVEIDPYWTTNYSAYNTTWSQDTTYSDLSEFNDDILWTSTFNATGNTLWTTETYVNLQNDSLVNYIASNNVSINNYILYVNSTMKSYVDATGGGSETDPYWSENYTLYNESWTTTWDEIDNSTFAYINEPYWSANYTAYNDSWSAGGSDATWLANWTAYNTTWGTDTTYSQGTNMSFDGTTINWDGSWAVSVFAWASDLLSKVSWADLWNQVYNETEVNAINTSTTNFITSNNVSINNYILYTNSTMKNYVDNEFVELSGDTMTGNLTIGTNSLLNQTGGARIYHNGTGWLIIG